MVELFFVDDEKTIVDVWDSMNVDGGVLRVVFVKVEAKGRGDALGINASGNMLIAFGQLKQHRMVDVVVDEDNG